MTTIHMQRDAPDELKWASPDGSSEEVRKQTTQLVSSPSAEPLGSNQVDVMLSDANPGKQKQLKLFINMVILL